MRWSRRPTSWGWPSSAVRSAGSCWPRGALAAPALVDGKEGPRVRPKRARVIDLSTHPPAGVTVVCADELGPVVPRTFPPAPGWSADGHRVKAPLEDGRGSEQDLGVRRAAGGG